MILALLSDLIFILGCLFLSLMIFEFIAFIIIWLFLKKDQINAIQRGTLMDPNFEKPDSYTDVDTWYKLYCKEAKLIFENFKWQPLGLWSSPRFHGEYINIGKYNLRRTICNEKRSGEDSNLIIWFFGGSTVWGWGARDTNTIPSQLLCLRPDCIIENYAQLGFVSSQEVIYCIENLKNSPKPTIIVFLDGLNDMYSAYQSNIAGIEQNAIKRKSIFESKNQINLKQIVNAKSNLYKLFKRSQTYNNITDFQTLTDNEQLASSIVKAYNQNIQILTALLTAYQIKPLFFWQPTIFDKVNLTEYENKVKRIVDHWQPVHTSVKQHISKDKALDKRVIDLSDLFMNETKPIYIDPWHYNEYANNVLALTINKFIQPIEMKIEDKLSRNNVQVEMH